MLIPQLIIAMLVEAIIEPRFKWQMYCSSKSKWLEIKGGVQKACGKLTDDELEKFKGDMKINQKLKE